MFCYGTKCECRFVPVTAASERNCRRATAHEGQPTQYRLSPNHEPACGPRLGWPRNGQSLSRIWRYSDLRPADRGRKWSMSIPTVGLMAGQGPRGSTTGLVQTHDCCQQTGVACI